MKRYNDLLQWKVDHAKADSSYSNEMLFNVKVVWHAVKILKIIVCRIQNYAEVFFNVAKFRISPGFHTFSPDFGVRNLGRFWNVNALFQNSVDR
jgi:hypothetical protein